ncbi:MAG: GGDEF domain-containing protein [Acidobacteria bacterium]|nr:GGDEF domain-containing protein [Candidatus Sulfomarinibacter sp. MAG AM2]
MTGGLPVLAAWLAGLLGLTEVHRPVVDVLAEVLAVLLMVLAWRYRRGRLAVAALAIAVSNFLIRGPLSAAHAEPGVTALALALPVCLALLALLPEQPIGHPLMIGLMGGVVILGWLALALPTPAGDASAPRFLGPLSDLLAAPDLARLVFLIAGAFIALAFAARRGTFEGSLLWVTAASALALLDVPSPQAPTLAFTAAQLVLLLGLIEDSYRLAYHDELTGLPGRRALEEALRTLVGDYAIAMVDVDRFKRFNDRHGHGAGDQALRMVATELQGVGGGGRAYRYGGEEFAILFPGSPAAAARQSLEEVRVAIAGRKFAIRGPDRPRKKPDSPRKKSKPSRTISVAVSIGLAGPNPKRTTADAVLRAADRALYRAKKEGRNRLVAVGDRSPGGRS